MNALGTSVCSVTFRTLDAEAVLDLAIEAKLDAVEWGADVHCPAGDLDTARRLAARGTDSGIAVSSYGSYLFAGAEAGFGNMPRPDLGACLDTAVALGAPMMRVWAGRGSSAKASGEDRARVADDLSDICAAAESRGLAVSLEWHIGTLTDDLESALRLFEAVGADNLYTHWQPRPGIDQPTALAEVAALASRLSGLHVFTWADDGERLPLADGADRWQEVLVALPNAPAGWDGPRYATLEFVREDRPDQFLTDAAALRGWL